MLCITIVRTLKLRRLMPFENVVFGKKLLEPNRKSMSLPDHSKLLEAPAEDWLSSEPQPSLWPCFVKLQMCPEQD
jgi:hypothetical protein